MNRKAGENAPFSKSKRVLHWINRVYPLIFPLYQTALGLKKELNIFEAEFKAEWSD